MTEMLFRDNAYLRECEAIITAVRDDGFLLDRTIFYPTGGGQPGDTGEIISADGVRVAIDNTIHADNDILHCAPDTTGLAIGQAVTARIDWERRYAHMRMHTALHLLGAVLRYPVTGGSITAQRSRLDFDMQETVDKEAVSSAINSLVEADHEVKTRWITDAELDAQPELIRTMSVKPPRGAGRIRLLEIESVDLQPCGGTHVRRTAEIGPLALGKVQKKGARNRRVNIVFASPQST
ncbi:MAG: alanyl-tRNA editing protein [Gammaproteobacteria bacterium]|nr:alanyl-tRNA editing protein [Gammaproteobacteria bacterium]